MALSSSDSTRLTVPASITIPAGQTQAQFDLNVIANCTGDGSHTVTITVLAQNSPAVQNSLDIIDTAIPGDLNGNCVVDYDDLVILLSYMGQPAQACPACDLDGDSVIDSGDVSLLESYCTCSGCVCPTTIQRTDPTLAQSVPALGKYGVGFLLTACVLILIGCANRLKNDGHGLK